MSLGNWNKLRLMFLNSERIRFYIEIIEKAEISGTPQALKRCINCTVSSLKYFHDWISLEGYFSSKHIHYAIEKVGSSRSTFYSIKEWCFSSFEKIEKLKKYSGKYEE